MTDAIATAVRAVIHGSGFDEEQEVGPTPPRQLCFTTRDNGDVESCTPGRADVLAARALRDAIQAKVPGVTARVSTCDEWTFVTVEATP